MLCPNKICMRKNVSKIYYVVLLYIFDKMNTVHFGCMFFYFFLFLFYSIFYFVHLMIIQNELNPLQFMKLFGEKIKKKKTINNLMGINVRRYYAMYILPIRMQYFFLFFISHTRK